MSNQQLSFYPWDNKYQLCLESTHFQIELQSLWHLLPIFYQTICSIYYGKCLQKFYTHVPWYDIYYNTIT